MLTYSDTYDSCRRTCQALPNAQYLQFPVWLVSAYFILPFFRLLSNNLKATEIKPDHTYSVLLYHETPEFARCIFRSHTIIFQYTVILLYKKPSAALLFAIAFSLRYIHLPCSDLDNERSTGLQQIAPDCAEQIGRDALYCTILRGFLWDIMITPRRA